MRPTLSSALDMNNFCRICGKLIEVQTCRKKQLKIIKMLSFWHKNLEFDPDRVWIGHCCAKNIKAQHHKDYSYRKPTKHVIGICLWDYKRNGPVLGQGGKPLMYSKGQGRGLNGKFRGKNDPLESHEIEYPASNMEISDSQESPQVEFTPDIIGVSEAVATAEVSAITRRKSDRDRIKKITDKNILHSKIKQNVKDGLTIIDCGSIVGLGVQTTKSFKPSEYVTTYSGELRNKKEAEMKEKEYDRQNNQMSYTHYFRHNEKTFCYDATIDDGSLGRLINHSKKNKNIQPKVEVICNVPYIYFKALKHIPIGTQLLYDYGDRKTNKPWLKL